MCVAHGSRWQSTCSKEKKKMPGYLFCFYCFQFSFFIFSSPCVSLPSFSGRTVPACSLLLTKSQREIENHSFSVEARVGILCFHCAFSSAICCFFFLRKKKKKDPGTIFGSSRRLRCAIWVKCRKATRNWPSHRLASLGHLVGLLVKHIEWSHFLSLSLVWGCWFDYPLGM